MIEIERVGDIVKTFNITPDKEAMPKKIVCELSECKTYYNCRLYFDMVEDGKIREALITVKVKEPSYVYDFRIIPDDDEKTMVTITISDMDD